MAVGYRSSSTTGTSDNLASSIDVPVPSGAAANDIALVAIEMWEIGNPTVTAPTGFTLITTVVSGSQKLKVFWKRLTGADSGTYTFTWSGTQWNQGQCVLMTGVVTSGDPIGSDFNTATSASGTSVPSTSVTVAFQPGLAHFAANENSSTKTAPTSFTEVQDANYLESNYRIPGSTGTFTASGGTLSASSLSLALLAALQPASGGGGPVAFAAIGSASNGAQGSAATARPMTGIGGASADATGSMSVARGIGAYSPASAGFAADLSKAGGTARDLGGSGNAAAEFIGAGSVARSLAGSGDSSNAGAGEASLARAFAGTVSAAASIVGDLTLAQQMWRLIPPTRIDEYQVRGRLRTTLLREVTVFGDDDGLNTSERGTEDIPFGTKYIWLGGHVNITVDPAIKNLWLSHGFEVQVVMS